MSAAAKPLLVTAGDPAGIGPELCLGIADEAQKRPFIVITDAEMLRERAALLGLDVRVREVDISDAPEHGEREILVHHLPFAVSVACGKPDPANAAALIEGLRLAATACQDGTAGALVTAPLAKSVICDSGVPFSGHTEFLAELTGAALPVMLLAAGDLRVALASTHLPLREVPDFITSERLHAVLDVLHSDLRAKFAIDDPDIVVCGLNPHAGESGHLGHEDAEIIAPVVEACRAKGWRVRGPLPADTAFTPAAGKPDAVLAMYHDQGLPVIKYAGFGDAVNVTLGLPIIRTSVDHGTAFDIAGEGKADAGSLRAALALAAELAARQ